MTKTEKLNRRVEEEKEVCTREFALFQKNFEQNPAYAFEWAERTIEAAARQVVAFRVGALLTNVTNLPEAEFIAAVSTEVTREALRGARHPERSTSVVSNLTKQAQTQIWAEWAEFFSRF